MGVDISPLMENVTKVISFESLMNKRIALDAFNMLYQFLASIRGEDGTPLKDHQGHTTSHLAGILYRSINLLENDIKPIFIFDGPPHPLKMAEIERRRTIRYDATKKMREAQDLGETEEAAKFAQASSKLDKDMIEDSKALLKALGMPVIEAAQDGEAQAAFLVLKDLAWAVGSQDYDSFLFGSPRVVRNLSQSRTRKVKGTTVKVDLEWISLEKTLGDNSITHAQLIDIGILIGVDFFPGVKGFGSKTALKLIKEHGSLENMLDAKVTYHNQPLHEFITKDILHAVQDIFLNPKVTTDLPPLSWRTPDVAKVKEILYEQHNFDPNRVENALERLIKKGRGIQTSLQNFMKKP